MKQNNIRNKKQKFHHRLFTQGIKSEENREEIAPTKKIYLKILQRKNLY